MMANRKKNFLAALKDNNGDSLESTTEIGNYLIKKFSEVFQMTPTMFCDCLEEYI